MEEKCENCKYYAELELFKRKVVTIPENSNVVSGLGIKRDFSRFEKSHCCLMFYMTEMEMAIQETNENDMCEMFEVKK